jgi:hypothetical protein
MRKFKQKRRFVVVTPDGEVLHDHIIQGNTIHGGTYYKTDSLKALDHTTLTELGLMIKPYEDYLKAINESQTVECE